MRGVTSFWAWLLRSRPVTRPRKRPPGSVEQQAAQLVADATEIQELSVMLSARAQAIVDRAVALATHLSEKIANDEAAHDAANAAAIDTDDTAIEGAFSTLEAAVGAQDAAPSNPDQAPLPPADGQE